jgi:predicted TIM-barrel fold metal-dependent hydrolase
MAEYGIRGGLVSHWDGLRVSPQEGNQALADAEASLPENAWTVWTALPLAPAEQGPLPGTGAPHPRLRGVRLFPKTHHFQLSPWVIGSLCEWCMSRRLPLFLWHVEIDWDPLHDLAAAFPGLTIVVDTQWQKILYHNRDLFSLLEACRNVVVESSNLLGQDFLAWVVHRWGAERVLYGSFLPANDPYAAIGMILDADLSPEEKLLVAGGNARRIVEGVRA